MAANADFWIVYEEAQRLAKRISLAGTQKRFADAYGMLPDAGMSVAHAGNGMFCSQLVKAIERA